MQNKPFRYRPTGSRKDKTCTLKACEFIRRFLQHVLPKGFVKVRYYGLFSPAHRPQLARLRQALAADEPPIRLDQEAEPSTRTPRASPAISCSLCPTCGRPMQGCALPPGRGGRPP